MVKIDDRELKELEADLKTFAHKAFPFATRNTLNVAAFAARSHAQENIRGSMITRNKFTERSVQVDKARTLNVSRQAATVGSTADYMETQEFGGTKTGEGGGVAIATSYSAGQAQSSQPRTRLPRRANKLANIQLRKKHKRGSTRQQRNLIAIREAAGSGRKFVFLDLGKRRGIFKVTGGKRRARIKMVHDLSRRSVAIPKNPWLLPAAERTRTEIPGIYKESLLFQKRRLQLFK